MLPARIQEALPLSRQVCQGQMRIIALVNNAGPVNKILDHIGEPTRPPRIAPARGPPPWQAAGAAQQAQNDRQRDWTARPVPEIELDQRIAW